MCQKKIRNLVGWGLGWQEVGSIPPISGPWRPSHRNPTQKNIGRCSVKLPATVHVYSSIAKMRCFLSPERVNPGMTLEAEGRLKGDDEGVPSCYHWKVPLFHLLFVSGPQPEKAVQCTYMCYPRLISAPGTSSIVIINTAHLSGALVGLWFSDPSHTIQHIAFCVSSCLNWWILDNQAQHNDLNWHLLTFSDLSLN